MKKAKRLLFIIISILLVATGCRKNNKELDSKDLDEDEYVESIDEEDSTDLKEKEIMDRFLSMINPETSAADLVEYIKNNIKDVGDENAEEMIKWLTIYQTEIIDDFDEKIYESGYIEALNEDMNGVLDQRKISNIKNESIRKDYQKLIDSFVTIIKYEERPVVESNWKKLNEFSSYVSEEFSEMMNLYKEMQSYLYDPNDINALKISEDIIKAESILEKSNSNFIKEKLNELYSIQIYTLLVGPEGRYLDIWTEKDSDGYKDIMELKEKYPESTLAEIISEADKSKDESVDIIGVLNKKLQFGIKSNKYIEEIIFVEENNEYSIIELRIPDNKEKQDAINQIIKEDIEDYLKENHIDESFSLNIFHSYEDQRYISYEGVLSIEDFQGNYITSISFYRTLDYIDEKFISLEEYLEADTDTIKDDLRRISGREINFMPDFLISYDGIDLFLKEGNHIDGYLNLTKKDLAPYFIKRNK